MTVRLLLLFYDGHVPDSQLLRQLFDAFKSRAVERRVDKLQIRNSFSAADTLRVNGIYKRIQYPVWDVPDTPGGQRRIKVHGFCAGKIVHVLQQRNHALCRLRRHLAAVGAVDLIAVVFRRVVAGRNADAEAAVQMAHGKTQRRNRLKAGVEIGCDAVGRKNCCRFTGKNIALDAAVMADGNGLRQIRLIEILCNCLRCAADHIDIHPVRARAEHAAQACRTKLQIAVERVGDLLCIRLHRIQFRTQFRLQSLLRKPLLVSFFCQFHICKPPFFSVICVYAYAGLPPMAFGTDAPDSISGRYQSS